MLNVSAGIVQDDVQMVALLFRPAIRLQGMNSRLEESCGLVSLPFLRLVIAIDRTNIRDALSEFV